jgi:hypothetical protein
LQRLIHCLDEFRRIRGVRKIFHSLFPFAGLGTAEYQSVREPHVPAAWNLAQAANCDSPPGAAPRGWNPRRHSSDCWNGFHFFPFASCHSCRIAPVAFSTTSDMAGVHSFLSSGLDG